MLSTTMLLAASMVVGQAAGNSQIPKEVLECLDSSVGRWSVELTTGETVMKGKAVIRLTGGGNAIIANIAVKDGDTTSFYDFVSGWDSSTNGFTDQVVSSSGDISTTHWNVVSATISEGVAEGMAGGKKTTGKTRMDRGNPDQIVVTITDRRMGDEKQPDTKIVYRRMVEAKKKGKN